MKKIIYLCVVLFAVACSNQEKKGNGADGGWDVTVSGKVKFPNTAQVTIEELTPSENPKKDSLKVNEDGTYSKTIHLTEPGYYRFNFFNAQFVDVVLDKSNIELNVDGNDQSGEVEIKGSPDYDVIREVQEKLQKFQLTPAVRQIESEWQVAVQAKQQDKIETLQEQYMELHYAAYDSIAADLARKPVSLGLVNLLQGNTFQQKHRYYPVYKKVADKAIAQWPNSIHAKQFNEMVQRMSVTAIGVTAPEITLPDPNGKMISLSSLRGKYVLVDFWAKWCGPCRAENPNVVKAYKKYKDKGFEVFGVSLDRSREDWVQAIEQDGLTWTHVSDLKYFESQAVQDYNITEIPFSILVDPNGVIIAKDLRRAALHKKLEEVLGKKS